MKKLVLFPQTFEQQWHALVFDAIVFCTFCLIVLLYQPMCHYCISDNARAKHFLPYCIKQGADLFYAGAKAGVELRQWIFL